MMSAVTSLLPSPSILSGLPPVFERNTHTLILGSFPGVASLAARQYYAHPRNQFWPLLSAVLDDRLTDLPYPQRLQRLSVHRIGLWDVIASCNRSGSLDSAIRDALANDFALLKQCCPQLSLVCFNGKAAARFASAFGDAGYKTMTLPSSSPANAQLSFPQKLAIWQHIKSEIGHADQT